jgi:predicted DNA-binding transcriptional regulator AlpA
MKIFAVRDENDNNKKNLAYLFYYEQNRQFYIELPEEADPWETPLLLSSFVKRGEKTVDSYWSRQWVKQRIIPAERQNLGQILKDNHLKEYDEYQMLMLSMGRCAQDDYYLELLEEEELPQYIKKRFLMHIEEIIPVADYHILVFFRDGHVKKCSMREIFCKDRSFDVLLRREELFYQAQIQTGGYGVSWDINMAVGYDKLYRLGRSIPLSIGDFQDFVANRVITAAESAELLGCSRQNIEDLTKRGKLHPVKSGAKTTLFLKSEIQKRNWQ